MGSIYSTNKAKIKKDKPDKDRGERYFRENNGRDRTLTQTHTPGMTSSQVFELDKQDNKKKGERENRTTPNTVHITTTREKEKERGK